MAGSMGLGGAGVALRVGVDGQTAPEGALEVLGGGLVVGERAKGELVEDVGGVRGEEIGYGRAVLHVEVLGAGVGGEVHRAADGDRVLGVADRDDLGVRLGDPEVLGLDEGGGAAASLGLLAVEA